MSQVHAHLEPPTSPVIRLASGINDRFARLTLDEARALRDELNEALAESVSSHTFNIANAAVEWARDRKQHSHVTRLSFAGQCLYNAVSRSGLL